VKIPAGVRVETTPVAATMVTVTLIVVGSGWWLLLPLPWVVAAVLLLPLPWVVAAVPCCSNQRFTTYFVARDRRSCSLFVPVHA
jgi:hypothetical protein